VGWRCVKSKILGLNCSPESATRRSGNGAAAPERRVAGSGLPWSVRNAFSADICREVNNVSEFPGKGPLSQTGQGLSAHVREASVMRLPTNKKSSRACLALIGIVAIFVASGCESMPLYRVRGHIKRARPVEYIGVDDVDFHGHSKTCWRNWNNAAWSTYDCYPGGDFYQIPGVPVSEGRGPGAPNSGVPQVPPMSKPEGLTAGGQMFQ
jgi:hypothetical protein